MSEEIDFTQVREGDRIKVTQVFEGVAHRVRGSLISIRTDDGWSIGATDDTALCREQRIERKEQYVPGGIYRSASDLLYIYDPKDAPSSLREYPWKLANSSDRREFDYPKRPMTRLEKRQ